MVSISEVAVLVSGTGWFLLDQLTKRMVQYRSVEDRTGGDLVPRIRRVTHRENFYNRDGGRALLVLLWLGALAISIILFHSGESSLNRLVRFGLALMLGGSAGNLVDILRWQYVLDFVDLGWWPVFNLADVGMVVGAFLVLCNMF
jgi:signal peptidase II